MKPSNSKLINLAAILLILLPGFVWAAGRGGGGGGGSWSFGFNVGIVNADQNDVNGEISARSPTNGAKEFGNAYEGNAFIAYQIQGSDTTLMLRPSYMYYADQDGTGASYSLNGFTIFPMLRFTLLSDQTIRFYSQVGVGYGQMNGEISDSEGSESFNVKFSGGDIGYMFGLGAEFCFFGSHCVNVEGNMRILSIDRMIVDSVTDDPTGITDTQFTQMAKGQELEVRNRDLGTSMSGIVGLVGYAFHF